MRTRIISGLSALACSCASLPAFAAPWWYVGHDADRVTFVEASSIERAGDTVTYWSREVAGEGGRVTETRRLYMQSDCRKHQSGWMGIERHDPADRKIDTSTRPRATLEDISPDDRVATGELAFVCASETGRAGLVAFPIAIDDIAFARALWASNGEPARALHDQMAANPAVPVIRSTAPATASFGAAQIARSGDAIVPPRDYSVGPMIPDPSAYSPDEVGRIYDIAYQGIRKGELQFEVRGYSISDLVHPGSGQIETFPVGVKQAHVRDILVTITSASADKLAYSVRIEHPEPPEAPCTSADCLVVSTVEAPQ